MLQLLIPSSLITESSVDILVNLLCSRYMPLYAHYHEELSLLLNNQSITLAGIRTPFSLLANLLPSEEAKVNKGSLKFREVPTIFPRK